MDDKIVIKHNNTEITLTKKKRVVIERPIHNYSETYFSLLHSITNDMKIVDDYLENLTSSFDIVNVLTNKTYMSIENGITLINNHKYASSIKYLMNHLESIMNDDCYNTILNGYTKYFKLISELHLNIIVNILTFVICYECKITFKRFNRNNIKATIEYIIGIDKQYDYTVFINKTNIRQFKNEHPDLVYDRLILNELHADGIFPLLKYYYKIKKVNLDKVYYNNVIQYYEFNDSMLHEKNRYFYTHYRTSNRMLFF